MIQCGSRTFSQAERNYAPIEQECLAIQWSVERCRHYLIGNPGFTVITDHNPLVGIFSKCLGDIDNRRLQRMRERLLGYQFEVKWVPGKSHLIADALSRYPVEQADQTAISVAASLAVVPADLFTIAQVAKDDNDYQKLVHAVSNWSKDELRLLSLIHI